MGDIDHDKLDAALERLEAERERRLAERIEAGEVVSVPLLMVAGSEAEARAQVEEAKAAALTELRATGDQRAVVFTVKLIVTGVVTHGEAGAKTEPWKPVSPPFLPSYEKVNEIKAREKLAHVDNTEELAPVIETYIAVQVGRCQEDDPGQIAEGWFSVDNGQVIVTNSTGKFVGSQTLLKGEDAKAVAKRLLREKTPEEFNRRLDYPLRGWA
jgi:hypothetical protein